MNVSLAGSFQVTPSFWGDPKTGIPYQVWVQTPEYRNDSLTALHNTPLFVSATATTRARWVSSAASPSCGGTEETVINHVNTQPT